MAEKKGFTGQLKYDFDTARNLEVYLKGKWFRTTSREFRSFNGKRRIQGEEYNGPVYLCGTNTKVNPKEYSETPIVGHKWESIRRAGENW